MKPSFTTSSLFACVAALAVAQGAMAQTPQPAPAAARPPPSTPGMPTLQLPPNPTVPRIRYSPELGEAANYAVYNLQVPPPKAPEGFTPLFNGKDLSGFHISKTAGHGHTPDFHVFQGMILGTQQPIGRGGLLISDKKFKNYELYIEAKADWGSDSGIFIRTTEEGATYQITMDYLPGGSMGSVIAEGGIVGVGRPVGETTPPPRPAPAPGAPPPPPNPGMMAWKHNDWNEIRVRVEGDTPHIQVWINGKQVTDFTDTANHAAGGMVTGPFAVQVHGGDARWVAGNFWRWRNIAVRELP